MKVTSDLTKSSVNLPSSDKLSRFVWKANDAFAVRVQKAETEFMTLELPEFNGKDDLRDWLAEKTDWTDVWYQTIKLACSGKWSHALDDLREFRRANPDADFGQSREFRELNKKVADSVPSVTLKQSAIDRVMAIEHVQSYRSWLDENAGKALYPVVNGVVSYGVATFSSRRDFIKRAFGIQC